MVGIVEGELPDLFELTGNLNKHTLQPWRAEKHLGVKNTSIHKGGWTTGAEDHIVIYFYQLGRGI